MTSQGRVINCDKCANSAIAGGSYAAGGICLLGAAMPAGGRNTVGISTSQFCMRPKLALKEKSLFKKSAIDKIKTI